MAAPATGWRDRIRRAFTARDEGELENAMNDLPDNAELHLHVGGNGNGEAPGDQIPMPMDRALKAYDNELEEIWRALAAAQDAIITGNGRKFRTARDSFKHAARTARRMRMGLIRDEDEDEEEKASDARFRSRGRDEDKDDDDDKDKSGDARRRGRGRDEDEDKDDDKSGDGFRDPPEAGGNENRSILPGFMMEAPPGTGDSHRKARDSAFMTDSFQETLAYGDILVPGIRLPTFDAALPPQKTHDALCAFRSKVIDLAWNHPDTRTLIEDMSGGRFSGVEGMDCQRVRDLFVAVGAAKARENQQAKGRGIPEHMMDGGSQPVGTVTLAGIGAANAEFWAKQNKH